MGRGPTVVFVLCVTIIVSFSVMVYLMGNIDPPKIVDDDSTGKSLRREMYKAEDMQVFKGLKKGVAPGSKTIINETLSAITTLKNENVTVPPATVVIHCHLPHDSNISHRFTNITHEFVNITNISSQFTNISNQFTHISNVSGHINYNASETNKTVKGKRRSVDSVEKKISGPVVLKILDDFGDSRIEFKLKPITLAFTSDYKNVNNIETNLNQNGDFFTDGEIRNMNDTEIIIMPNNSIVVNEAVNNMASIFNYSTLNNIVELRINDHILTFKEIYEKNLTDNKFTDDITIRSVKEHFNTTESQILALKLLFNNETTSNNTMV